MSSSYRMELDKWLSNIEVDAELVLDVGGSQLPVYRRVKSWHADQYFIVDLPEPHVNSPKPDIEFNLEEQDWAHEYQGIKADLVFCLEVFDYIVLPDCALSNLKDMTRKGGTIWATFPFVYPTHQPLDAEGLRYTENSIYRLAEMCNLKVEEVIRRRPETNAIENLWRSERMRAAKGYDHNVTGWIVRFSNGA